MLITTLHYLNVQSPLRDCLLIANTRLQSDHHSAMLTHVPTIPMTSLLLHVYCHITWVGLRWPRGPSWIAIICLDCSTPSSTLLVLLKHVMLKASQHSRDFLSQFTYRLLGLVLWLHHRTPKLYNVGRPRKLPLTIGVVKRLPIVAKVGRRSG